MLSFIDIGDLAIHMQVAQGSLTTALADLAVSAAQKRIREYLEQEVTYHASDVVYLDGNGKTKIRLPERPVVDVTRVEEGLGGTSWTELDADNYFVRKSILIRWDGAVWCVGDANLRVTYDHGYYTGDIDSDVSDSDFDPLNVPSDLVLVALSLARRMYENMGSEVESLGAGNIKQETIGSYSYTLSSAAEAAAGVTMLKAEMAVLDSYKFRGAG